MVVRIVEPKRGTHGCRVLVNVTHPNIEDLRRTEAGSWTVSWFGASRLPRSLDSDATYFEGRECDDKVMALPREGQCLLRQVPLERMDSWIDLTAQRLVGNPEHGGKWMAEAY